MSGIAVLLVIGRALVIAALALFVVALFAALRHTGGGGANAGGRTDS